ncbi:helix-turn-helix domain-containing protein [Streptomyces acidiscabies]|uniref:Helix-turn-helix domain-containing protein n=1 Tax=Streptomyces acidiscabies TaxID=42234 RepID=A0AAP6BMG7_9ACTN|nr:helix-turn-helix domain-containing protein [Streptomyces acidiscabies]MBZ3918169.1 helix-turn-helix domain-containing protein [Streptomyces acidiscabies]MDX2967268.1 helix-turn-helix domain-containing protein [Streptomyces acidiscabies]MDX3016764.1 helix-turn-helix domain-containing protein [Streptomyces acidiscabies]MDX3794067.1 helix-turn-helix domain-containing protein [Streptomyces acidiscabies]
MTTLARGALGRDEILKLPAAIDIETAARAFGLGRTTAYALAKSGNFPCGLIKAGQSYRVITADLIRVLQILPGQGDGAEPCPSDAA